MMTIALNAKGSLHLVSFKGQSLFMDSATLNSFIRPFGKALVENKIVTLQQELV